VKWKSSDKVFKGTDKAYSFDFTNKDSYLPIDMPEVILHNNYYQV